MWVLAPPTRSGLNRVDSPVVSPIAHEVLGGAGSFPA